MIRKAVGIVISRMIVTATTKRTIGKFATRISMIGSPRSTITATSATVSRMSSGTTVNTTLPGSVSRSQLRPMTVMASCLARQWMSFIDAAHDRIEAGHDGHRVGDEVAGRHDADRLEVD